MPARLILHYFFSKRRTETAGVATAPLALELFEVPFKGCCGWEALQAVYINTRLAWLRTEGDTKHFPEQVLSVES